MTGDTRISFDGVGMVFDTDRGALRVAQDVTFDIRDREFVSLIGPSGCGKSTMLNMVAGFLRPSEGEVTIDGGPIMGPSADRGAIFQEYGVFPWLTVADNIAFGLKLAANRTPRAERAEIVERYMGLMGLTEFRDSFPKDLSGGMRQRLALARAYAVKPQFLLMDEPFGALDAQTRSAMQNLLQQVLQEEGKTVMLITHSVEEALYLSSRIVIISARPARVRRIIDVPFAYPRQSDLIDTREFIDLRGEVRELVMKEYQAQQEMA